MGNRLLTVCRQWLEGVVQVILSALWKTRKAAAQCLSRAVEHRPSKRSLAVGYSGRYTSKGRCVTIGDYVMVM